MSAEFLPGWDATGVNVAKVPPGLGVPGLYVTGSGGVPATAEQLATYREAVRIGQSPSVTAAETTADAFDVETGAITIASAPAVYREALANFKAGVRPGQRYPCFYVDQANLTPLCNEFVAAGITSGPRLWVAYLGIAQADAEAKLAASGGPFPLAGIQTANHGTYDSDLWLASWVYTGSVAPLPVVPTVSGKTLVSVTFEGTWSDGSTSVLGTVSV